MRTQRLIDTAERLLAYGAPIGVAVASFQLGQRWNLVALGLILAALARSSRHDIVALAPDGPLIRISFGYFPVHRVAVEHERLDIRRGRDEIVFRGPDLPAPGLSYSRRTRHGLGRMAEALTRCGIEIMPFEPDELDGHEPTGSPWSRLTHRISGSPVLGSAVTFVVALAAIGALHVLNGPSEEGMTSSWAEVVGYSAFTGGAVLVFGLIDRFDDRRNAGPGSS